MHSLLHVDTTRKCSHWGLACQLAIFPILNVYFPIFYYTSTEPSRKARLHSMLLGIEREKTSYFVKAVLS